MFSLSSYKPKLFKPSNSCHSHEAMRARKSDVARSWTPRRPSDTTQQSTAQHKLAQQSAARTTPHHTTSPPPPPRWRYPTPCGDVTQVVVPPKIYETVQALGYHHLGDLYTPDHRILGERALKERAPALKERAPARKGIPGLRMWLAPTAPSWYPFCGRPRRGGRQPPRIGSKALCRSTTRRWSSEDELPRPPRELPRPPRRRPYTTEDMP